jgi:hypothetical protein
MSGYISDGIARLDRLKSFRPSVEKKEGFALNRFFVLPALFGIVWLLSRLSYKEFFAMMAFCVLLSLYFYRKKVFLVLKGYFT